MGSFILLRKGEIMQEQSPNFNKVKNHYDRGLWSADRVRKAVGIWITQGECDAILSAN